MYGFQEDQVSQRKLIIKCQSDNCKGVLKCIHFLDDYSPRLDDSCSKCGKEVTMKLSHIEKSRIIAEEYM